MDYNIRQIKPITNLIIANWSGRNKNPKTESWIKKNAN